MKKDSFFNDKAKVFKFSTPEDAQLSQMVLENHGKNVVAMIQEMTQLGDEYSPGIRPVLENDYNKAIKDVLEKLNG